MVGRVITRLLGAEIGSGGVPIDTSQPGWTDAARARLFWGMYESAEIRLIREHMRADLPVIELGCSLGVLASHITSRLRPTAQYVGIEANPVLLQAAESNLRRNARCRWEVVNAAVVPDGTAEEIHFHTSVEPLDGKVERDLSDSNDTTTIPTIRLCDIRVRLLTPSWVLVMDIEGAEHDVVSESNLQGCVQVIAELHDHADRVAGDVVAHLRQLGFEIDAVDGNCYAMHRRAEVTGPR